MTYFGKRWRGESAHDNDHFERGRLKKAWSSGLGISADRPSWCSLKSVRQVGGKRIDCSGPHLDERESVGVHGVGERHRLAPRPVSCQRKKVKNDLNIMSLLCLISFRLRVGRRKCSNNLSLLPSRLCLFDVGTGTSHTIPSVLCPSW